jgi:hypothetical protein
MPCLCVGRAATGIGDERARPKAVSGTKHAHWLARHLEDEVAIVADAEPVELEDPELMLDLKVEAR